MAFRFEHPERPLDDNVRTAAKGEFDRAMAEVSETGFEVHGTVRNVRRRLKRVRSILRLIRPVFADYATENAQLRDIGAGVSELRDAAALVETVDRLALGIGGGEAALLDGLRRQFSERAAEYEARLDRDQFLMELRARLRDARVRSELWELERSGPRAVVPGFVTTYGKARAAFRLAYKDRSDDTLHEWRKRVKYHGAQLALLRAFAPPFSEIRRRRVVRLAAMLGDHQNLCLLRGEPGIDEGPLAPVVEKELDRLGKRALKVGRPLFIESVALVERRWSGYLADWKAVRRLQTAG